MGDLKLQLKRILERHEGHSNAITCFRLSELTGREGRIVRLAILELIREGLPVASRTEFPGGYFLITSYEEARAYADTLKRRLIKDAIRRRDFRKAADCYLKPAEQGRLLINV